MSRGPGRIERKIEAILNDAFPHETFTVSEIARRVYGYSEVVSREHTISVRRALISVRKRIPDWQWGRSTRRNRQLGHGIERILYNCRSQYAHEYAARVPPTRAGAA
jgi:hypothetical protein